MLPDPNQLVVFDTNVIEGRYLAPLLAGETCRDFQALREKTPPYVPAMYVKSYHEICSHAKRQAPQFAWMCANFGYPGGLEVGKAILRQNPPMDSEPNLYWLFGLAEEWRGLDWAEEQDCATRFVAAEERELALQDIEVRKRFATWKFALTHFLETLWKVLARNLTIITQYDVFGGKGIGVDEVFRLEQELAWHSLVPNEDLEIVVGSLAVGARALVTSDRSILSATALSLSLNHHTTFVHPDQLRAAADSGFAFRWSPEQTNSRDRAK